MGVQTLRPNATVQQGAYTTVVGGGTAHGNLADGSEAGTADGTAIDITANGYDATRGLILDLPNPTIPALARITGVRVRFRARDNSSWPYDSLLKARLRMLHPSGSYYVESGGGAASNWGATSLTTYNGAYETLTPDGREWTTSDLNSLQVLITAQTQFFGSGGRVSEVWVDVQYNEKPTIVTTSPAEGAVLGTMFPTLGYTYSDNDGDPLDAVRVKFFNAAQYLAGGFDPETAAAVVDSGWIGSSNPGAYTSPSALPNDSYRGYAKARHAFAGSYFETAWDYQAFSINVTPPPVPSLTATPDATNLRNTLSVTSGGASPTTEGYDFEYLEGGVWLPVRTYTVLGSGAVTNHDWEAPPNTARSYRVRSYRTSSGFRINSNWSNTATATLPVTRTRLSDPLSASAGIVVRLAGEALARTSEEQSQVLYALGRRNPIIISGTIQGEVYDLTLLFPDETSFQDFEALRNTQRVLLLRSARTWYKYVKLVGARGVQEDRTTADIAPYWYTVTVQAIEQDRP